MSQVPVSDDQVAAFQRDGVVMLPGDMVLFDFRTPHGARGNFSAIVRRALSLRWIGDDTRHVDRPGRTSPPLPGHGMPPGPRLRKVWVPVIWQRNKMA